MLSEKIIRKSYSVVKGFFSGDYPHLEKFPHPEGKSPSEPLDIGPRRQLFWLKIDLWVITA